MYKFPVGNVEDVDLDRIVAENSDSDAIVLPSDGTDMSTVLVKRSFVARFNLDDNIKIGGTVLTHGVGRSRVYSRQISRKSMIFVATDGDYGKMLPKGWVAIQATSTGLAEQIMFAQNYKRKIWVSVDLFDAPKPEQDCTVMNCEGCEDFSLCVSSMQEL